jgi:hypothetical protein
MEANGVGVQDEHFLSPPNRWKNQKGELGYPTILKELCGGGSTKWVDHLELVDFCYNNSEHSAIGSTPLSNGDGQVTNCAHDLGSTWITIE